MKLFILMMFVSLSCNALSPATKKETLSAKIQVTEAKPVHPALKKEEDCDDKAKKPIEIKPETITLGGNTGCTLPE